MKALIFIALLAVSTDLAGQQMIPPGTAIPVRLESSLSSSKSKPGQEIKARVMQAVPLAGKTLIPRGAKLLGHVISVTPSASGAGSQISFQFDRLSFSGRIIPITVHLRALASMMEIYDAQIPSVGADRGTPPASYTTVQVGGEVVYRGGGPVMSGSEVVGEPVPYGVLVRLNSQPGKPCRGATPGDDQPQALWLFSSDACGAYGFPHVTIAHAGRTNPAGVVVLAADDGALKILGGSGMLLRVDRSS